MVAFDELLGRELPFKVTEVDEEKTRLLISNRGAASDERMAAVRVGEVAEGIVTSVQPYGAFVDINGVAGLLHISQISHDRITNVDKVLSEGDRIKVRKKEAPAPAMPATLLGTLLCSCSALAYGFCQGPASPAEAARLVPAPRAGRWAPLPAPNGAAAPVPLRLATPQALAHPHDNRPSALLSFAGSGAEPGPRARPRGSVHQETGADAG